MFALGARVTTSSGDQPTWLRLYLDEYWTLEQVGELLGITREAVRLRLKAMGIKRSSGETARLRDRREISLRGDEIRDAFLQVRDVAETAQLVSLSEALVRRALGELVPDFEVLTRVPRDPAKKYSVDDLMDSLREAADATPGILTATGYDAFVAAHPMLPDGRPRPGKQAMTLRFGFWRDALLRAGLPANPRSGPDKEFDEAGAIAAVVECWRQTGSPPTADGYDRWQRDHEGRPSMATVRKLAGNWNPLLVRAWQLVHGVTLDQDDEDVSVPEQLLSDDGTQPGAAPFVPYCAANEGAEVSLRGDLVAPEYNALERAVRSHALIQNAVAAAAAAAGLEPWSPSAAGPTFDIVVSSDDGRVFVVEVKSATPENLELQLRIGLGQVLHYAHQLRSHAQVVIPAIAIELRPDQSWVGLLTELGVGLLVYGSIPSDLARLTGPHFAVPDASSQVVAAASQVSSVSEAGELLAEGKHLFAQGQYSDAETAIREAIRLNPDNAATHCDLGDVLRRMERYPEAEASYREAIRLDPDHSYAYAGLGEIFGGTEHHHEAVLAYREASRLNPDFAVDLTIAEEWLEFISTAGTQPLQGSGPGQQPKVELPADPGPAEPDRPR